MVIRMDAQPSDLTDRRKAFEMLDAERAEAGIPVSLLCRRADLDPSTYTRLKQDAEREPHYRTMSRLKRALAELRAQRAA